MGKSKTPVDYASAELTSTRATRGGENQRYAASTSMPTCWRDERFRLVLRSRPILREYRIRYLCRAPTV